jgi:ankyrin repeat protein
LDIVNADTGFDDSGWSRTLQRKLDMARTLIRHGAEVNVRDGAGRTPLFDAVWAGPDLVQCLIAAGADVGATSTDRYTALHEAVRASGSSGDTEVVGLLLQHGANVLAKDWQGKIPRDYANRSNQKLITFLKTFEQSNRMGIQLTPVGK